MGRSILVLLLASCTAPAQEKKGDSAELFQQMQAKLEKAESLTVRFKGEVGTRPGEKMTGSYSGTLRLESGGRFTLQMSVSQGGQSIQIEATSEGKIIAEAEGNKSEAECPKEFHKFLRSILTRTGMGVLPILLGEVIQGKGRDRQEVRIGELETGAPENVGQGRSRKVSYPILPDNDDRARAKTEVWIDEESALPLKRTGDWSLDDPMFVFSETYEISK